MKLSEITNIFKALEELEAQNPQAVAQHFDSLPRIPFPELPDRYKKEVREIFSVAVLRNFLKDCYASADFEKEVANMTDEEKEKLPDPAESYVSFETMTADIPDNTINKLLVQTRATAVYTILKPDEPMLFGNHACAAFEYALDKYRSASSKPAEKKKRWTAQKAAAAGKAKGLSNFVSAGYYQTIISDSQYQHALTAHTNKTAYIIRVDPAAFDGLNIEGGFLSLDRNTMGQMKRYKRGRYEDISEIDFPLLVQFYTAAFKSVQSYSYAEGTITVLRPQFFKEMGIDTHGKKAVDMMRKITDFENLWGIMDDDGEIGKVFDLIHVDPKTQTMKFAAPYMLRIMQKLDEKNHIERNTKQGELIAYEKPHLNMLVHSTIVSERNKPAVELVYLITNALWNRGFIADAKTYRNKQVQNLPQDIITYSVTFRTLLNSTVLLRQRIATYTTTADKNKALRRAFEKAYELLRTQTDIFQYFSDLKGNYIIPSMTTLNAMLEFSHKGKNGDYKPHI